MHDHRYQHDEYLIRRKVLTVLGAKFHVYDPDGQLVFFSRQKAFKLREDIRLFSGESMTEELLVLRARQIIDFGATYDVFDAVRSETVGSLRRRGLKSFLRDEWLVFDPDGRETGVIREDNASFATLRRLHEAFSLIFPQEFHIEVEDRTVATFRQNRNPLVQKIVARFSEPGGFDRRLGLAAGILLCAIEGRQEG